MPYTVEVDWAPVHELESSLTTFLMFRKYGRTLELGTDWAARVKENGGDELAAAVAGAAEFSGAVETLLMWQSPVKEAVDPALDWLAGLTPGDIYGRLMPYLPHDERLVAAAAATEKGEPRPASAGTAARKSSLLGDIGNVVARWDEGVRLLRVWNKVYFRSIDPCILDGLAADAASRRELVSKTPAEDLIEDATFGVRLDPTGAQVHVVLIPQYHFRPWNMYDVAHDLVFYRYPVDALPAEPGMPSPALLRVAHALSDASRLRIVRFLAGGTRSFTEIVKFSSLAKSTVHHHMMALRAAGLVRTHVPYPYSGGPDRYSLRPEAPDMMGASLSRYLKEE
jgi:DNA-binding transcriptional ArsR family regulator